MDNIERDATIIELAMDICRRYLTRRNIPFLEKDSNLVFGRVFGPRTHDCWYQFTEEGTFDFFIEVEQRLRPYAHKRLNAALGQLSFFGSFTCNLRTVYWHALVEHEQKISDRELEEMFEQARVDLARFWVLYLAAQDRECGLGQLIRFGESAVPVVGCA